MSNLRVLTPVLCVLFNLSAPVKAEPIKDLADLSLRSIDVLALFPDENLADFTGNYLSGTKLNFELLTNIRHYCIRVV